MEILYRLAAAIIAALPFAALAGGPLDVCGSASGNVAVKYPGNSVLLTLDQGTLGPLTNAQANALVTNAVALWTHVPTANIAIGISSSPLSTDVTYSNYATYYNQFADGVNPVIYDADGSVVDMILGGGSSWFVLGFAGSASSGYPACTYTEGVAVLSGKLLTAGEVTQAQMSNVVTHEIGHLIGLDHTQLDSAQGLATSNYPMMYPLAYRTTATLHEDDVAAVTALYPGTNVATTYATLSGTFTATDGTPLPGANIWAQGTGGAFSNVSDSLLQGTGAFSLDLPPGTYTLHAQAIETAFNGGSRVGPYSEDLNGLSFQPPFYTSANGGGTPFSATLGGATPIPITITPGCTGSVTFRIDGTGTVGGNCSVPPPTPTALSPSGNITTMAPTYAWSASSGATSYTLVVQNTSGIAINKSVSAIAAGCASGSGTCSFNPRIALANGATYDWSVSASNAAGTSAFSATMTITVSLPAGAPIVPTAVSPSGTIATASPAYMWSASSGASTYELVVRDASGMTVVDQVVSASGAGCGAGTGSCSVTPAAPLPNALYSWAVSATNEAGTAMSSSMAFTVSAPPPVPVQLSPSGTVDTVVPTFSWNASVGATGYGFILQDSSGTAIRIAGLSAAGLGCSGGGTCITPSWFSPTLTNGATYTWSVQSGNAVGNSAWSPAVTFTVDAPAPPSAPTPLAPAGTIGDPLPIFTWLASAGTTSYRIVILDGGSATVEDHTYNATGVGCGGGTGTCSWEAGPSLNDGNYTWTVTAINGGGSARSSVMGFTVSLSGTLPTVPVQVAPAGAVTSDTPTFSWDAVFPNTSYQVLVQDNSGTRVIDTRLDASSFGCAYSKACRFTPTSALANGTYSWWVRGWNALGHSMWSSGFVVTVNAPPAAPTLVSPNGTIATASPAYTWNASSGATSYRLVVLAGATTVVDVTNSAAAAGCGAGTGTCMLTPSTSLANGSYTWTVTATNAAGSNASGAMPFTVSLGASAPPTPTQIAPSGAVTTGTPGFTWNSAATATQYQVRLQNSAGAITIDTTLAASSFGCGSGGACTFTPSSALANDTYSWWVRAWNASGHSTWSSGLVVTVNAAAALTPPAAPTQIAPSGAVTTGTPSFTWNSSATATQYQVRLQNSAGATTIDTTLAASSFGCGSGGTCTFTPSSALPNDTYSWWVRAWNASGHSTWSAGMAITVNVSSSGVPAPPVQIGPNGTVMTTTPTYSWMPSTGATSYRLLVQSSAGTVIDVTYLPTDVGCSTGTTCSIMPSTMLASHTTYSWWVRANNASGHSTWSSGMAITTP